MARRVQASLRDALRFWADHRGLKSTATIGAPLRGAEIRTGGMPVPLYGVSLHSGRICRISDVINIMSQEYWENRYQIKDMPWEKGEGSPGLVDFLAAHPELPRGTVCVPGCGTGHDVRGWAKAGFEAYGFDIAPSAIELSKEKTKAAGLDAKYQLGDFLHDEPPFQFDWLFEHTLFCAINPSERDEYVRAVLRWLKPTGQFLAVHYAIPDMDGPPFGTTRDELWQRFAPHFELREEWVPRSYPNRTGEELMMWWGGKRRLKAKC